MSDELWLSRKEANLPAGRQGEQSTQRFIKEKTFNIRKGYGLLTIDYGLLSFFTQRDKEHKGRKAVYDKRLFIPQPAMDYGPLTMDH